MALINHSATRRILFSALAGLVLSSLLALAQADLEEGKIPLTTSSAAALECFQEDPACDIQVYRAAVLSAKRDGYGTITGDELLRKVRGRSTSEFILVDCRPANEFREGHVPGAVNVSIDSFAFTAETVLKSSLKDIETRLGRKLDLILIDEVSGDEYMPRAKLAELAAALPNDRDHEIIVYCRKPECTRSPLAARWAGALGYRNVRRYIGGWKEWANKGFPQEK